MVSEVVADAVGQMFALDTGPNGHRAILTKAKFVVTATLGPFERLVEDLSAHARTCLHPMAI